VRLCGKKTLAFVEFLKDMNKFYHIGAQSKTNTRRTVWCLGFYNNLSVLMDNLFQELSKEKEKII
jgi:hypothetical protein